MEHRLRRRIRAALLVLAAGSAAAGALAVGSGWSGAPPAGAGPSASAAAGPACQAEFRRFTDDAARATWFTLRARTDVNGVMTGNVVRVQRAGGGPLLGLELPVEAFADGPYDEGALVGSDDGQASTLRFLAPRGCGRVLRTASDVVIYRATVSPDGRSVITQHLERGTRADRGVWIAPIDDPNDVRQLLGPLVPDARFGVTWDTALTWSADGDRLVVESCTPSGCRFRIADPAGGATVELDDPGLGESIGVVGQRLFAFAACIDFRPCPVSERNLLTGATREIHPAVFDARLLVLRGRPWLVATDWDGTRERIQVIDPDTGLARSLPVPPLLAGFGLVRSTGDGSIGLPSGWIALAPGGRLPDGTGSGRLFAIDVETSRLLLLVGGNP